MAAGVLIVSAFPSWGNAALHHVWSHNRPTDQLRKGQTELQPLNKPVFIRTLFQVNEQDAFPSRQVRHDAMWSDALLASCRTQRHAVRFKSTKVSEEHVASIFRLTSWWRKKPQRGTEQAEQIWSWRWRVPQKVHLIFNRPYVDRGTRGSVVGWGTMLQA
jgi:hypothetical protein